MTNETAVIQDTDTLFYIKSEDNEIIGVGDYSSSLEIITYDEVNAFVTGGGQIKRTNIRDICIAWLLLNYPDSVVVDD